MLRLTVAVLLLLGVGLPASAQEEDSSFWSLQVENDKVAATDRHYTNGLRASWLSREAQVPDWVRDVAAKVPYFPEDPMRRWGLSLGHSIFTPENTASREPQTRQRPYAGWLYGGLGFVSDTGSRLDLLELQLGIVGPSAAGERVQNDWHRIIGVDPANGWDNQLKDEPGVVLAYARKWRDWQAARADGWAADATPHVGLTLGNVMTYGAAGLMLRAGHDLPQDYGPPLIRPSLPGTTYFLPRARSGFGWYVFAGVEGRAVLRNIFLDGNTFRDSPSVDKHLLVGDVQFGVALVSGRTRLAYTHVLRSREYEGQRSPDRFGAISLTIAF